MESTKYLVLLFCVTSLVTVEHVNSANILVISFFATKSHKMTYMPLIEELGKRGHNITVVSPVKSVKEMTNVKEIFTFDVEKLLQGGKFDPFETKEKEIKVDLGKMTEMVRETCQRSYELPLVDELLKEKFDLVFLQPFGNECVLGLVHRLSAPLVLFTPIVAPSIIVSKVGGHFPFSITPSFMLGYSNPMNFAQRFLNLGMEVVGLSYWRFMIYPMATKIYRDRLGNDIPCTDEILSNASLVLSNGHFSLTGPQPYYPDVVDVGGIHSRPPKPIPKDLEDFISKGKDGFILFSMGTSIKGDLMPDSKRKVILDVFSKLKQQVLWKWESETMPDLPKNVKLSKWLPQQDLLGHKDIKMFITHCGGGSTEEAIYHGVPLLGIPMIGDQPQNAKLAKSKGFLVELDWNNLTEENFGAAINEILQNPVYRDNVKRLSTLFNDRPQGPLELGVYWVEYVLRHNGAAHLRNVGRKLNFFQYHSYDVISAYLVIISAAIYLIFAVVRFICKKVLCRGRNKSTSLKKGKKIN